MSKIKVGLFGFGCVGKGFYEILQQNAALPYEVEKIGIKSSEKERPKLEVEWVLNPDDILLNKNISVIVEAIDDAEAALHIATIALQQGKIVISANKKMIAENLGYLRQLELHSEGAFFCEGAVAGSIPILQSIAHYYQFDQINVINGILNGSTNYILSQIAAHDLSYDQALLQAQEQGFAETDPSLDVEGYDARYKLTILIYLLFGKVVAADEIHRIGIHRIVKEDFQFAKKNGLAIKLIARAQKSGKGLQAWVAPQFVPLSASLGQVNNEYNAIELQSTFAGNQTLIGKGAGELPTGLALIGDLHRSKNSKGDFHSNPENDLAIHLEDNRIDVYFSYNPYQLVNWDQFDAIYEKYSNEKRSYVLGSIQMSKIKALQIEDSSLIFLSDTSAEFATQKLQYSKSKTGTFSL